VTHLIPVQANSMIYIATTPPNASAAHPAFKQRSISNLTAVQPSTITILGVPHAKELAYTGYKDNIDMFISATNRQQKLRTDAPGAILNFNRPTLSIPMPVIDYIPMQQLSSDQIEKLLQKFKEMDPIKKVIGKTTHIYLSNPDPSIALRLVQSSIPNTIPSPDKLTPRDFLAVSFLKQIASEFLATQTYPAWRSDEDRRDDEEILEQVDLQLLISSVKRVSLGAPDAKRIRPHNPDEDDEEMDQDDEEVPLEAVEINWANLRESVLVAKPSPLPHTFNIGGPSDVPKSHGLAFPYFDRMLIPDAHTLRNIVSTFFLRCLGDSREDQRANFRLIRASLEVIPRHRFGAELVHLFIGIRLSIETQTRLFVVVVSGDYAGFVLLGARFSVYIDSLWYDSKAPEDLEEDIATMSSHSFAVSRLCTIMSDLELKDDEGKSSGKKEQLLPDAVRSGHDLWDVLQSRVIPEKVHGDIQDQLRLVSFSRSYKEITPANIRWAIDMMSSKAKEPIPRDIPLHVPSALTQLDDRVLQVLCVFGPDSFSFQNMSGSKFALTPLSKTKDPNEDMNESGKGKVMPVIIVAVKGVLTAAADMRKTMKDRSITMDLKERAQRNRCIVFKGQQRDLVYSKLRELTDFLITPQGDRSDKGKKRQVDVGNVPATADDLLDLF